MFYLEKSIENVSEFVIQNNEIIYKNVGKLYTKSLFHAGVGLIAGERISGFQVINQLVCFSNWDNKTFIYDINSKQIKEIEYEQICAFTHENKFVLTKNNLLTFLNCDEERIFEFEIALLGINYLFSRNVLYNFINKFEIKKVIITSNQSCWKYILKENELIKPISTYQSELLVACSEGLIISIDIETGELKRSWQEVPNFQFPGANNNFLPKAEIFSLVGDKLIGALHTFLFEIDLITNEIIVRDLKEEVEKFGVLHIKQTTDNPVDDNHIYLTAMMHKQENDTKFSYDCLIALNRNTFKIDWQYKFETESLGTNIPKLAGNKLYQLDNGGTLHVFERVGE